MGWFLKKRKHAGRRPSRAATPPVAWQPRQTLAALKLLAAVLLVPCALIGWRRAEGHLWHYAATHAAAPATRASVELAAAPQWLDRLVREEIRELVALQMPGGGFDHQPLRTAIVALSRCAWVDRVDRVARRADGGVVVFATYRQPVAIVECADGYCRVDRAGVQLPGLFMRERVRALALPRVVGVSSPPPGEGRPWSARDLAGGLALVMMLDGRYQAQIEAIDVSDVDAYGRPRLALHTRHGMVRWGLAPGEGTPVEPDAGTKLQRLAQVQRQWQSIDAGGRIVEIYGPAVFIRRWEEQDRGVRTAYPR